MRWEWLVLGIVGILLVAIAAAGFMSALQNMGNFMLAMGVILLIGIIIFTIWFLFIRQEPIKITQLMRQNMVDSCVMGAEGVPAIATGLYLRGGTHGAGHRLGKIVGHATRFWDVLEGGTRVFEENEQGIRIPHTKGGTAVRVCEHIFQYKRDNGIINKLFGSPELICVFDVLRDGKWDLYHSELVGDIILYGNSPVKINKAYYLDTQQADPMIINIRDLEAYRTEMFLFMDNYNSIAEKALNANPSQKMEERNKQMLDNGRIPGLPVREPPLEG